MAFWRALPGSVKTALLITAGVIAYFVLSMMLRAGGGDIVEAEEERPFRVVTQTIEPAMRASEISLRATTQARRMVTVRAETPGQVRATPAPEGRFVSRGTTLCEIDVDTRSATLEEAQAAFEKARIDYEAAEELHERGFTSDAALASARAVYDQAVAARDRARSDLGNTSVTAPFAGIVEERLAEAGDYLNVGAPCARLAELDPIRIRGALPERDIAAVSEGDRATVTLATGETFSAHVTFVSAAASGPTRTYTVELEAENPGSVRAGQSATVSIETGGGNSWLLPHDAVVTDDEGRTGVRVVTREAMSRDGTGRVGFQPVSITGDGAKGFYVTGLSGTPEIIVRGQNYVRAGQEIEIAAPGETYMGEAAANDGAVGGNPGL